MSELKAEHPLAAWAVPDGPVTIEYSLQTLDEILAYAQDGLRQLSRGGVEVGGILYGARGENRVRILSWRPIACEHSKGPPFVLSQEDRMALGQSLQKTAPDPELGDLHAVGWFVSHTRGGVQLSESDLKIYNHYFPWSWQVALVLHPTRDGGARAGFFFREGDGSVKAESSYREFLVDPGPAPAKAPPPRAAAAPPPASPLQHPAGPRSFHPPPAVPRGPFSDRRLWIWAVPVLLAALVAAMIFQKPSTKSEAAGLGFHVLDSGGDLRLEWNKSADPIRDAVRGTLDLKDGTSSIQVPLAGDRLRDGNFTYSRKTGDVEVKMTVYPVNGPPVEESARFVGPPVSSPKGDESVALRRENESLVTEVKRLQEQLRKEMNRNRELEDAVRILQNRKEVERSRRPR